MCSDVSSAESEEKCHCDRAEAKQVLIRYCLKSCDEAHVILNGSSNHPAAEDHTAAD